MPARHTTATPTYAGPRTGYGLAKAVTRTKAARTPSIKRRSHGDGRRPDARREPRRRRQSQRRRGGRGRPHLVISKRPPLDQANRTWINPPLGD
eukprot:2537687-Prymnesium_polylepis.1